MRGVKKFLIISLAVTMVIQFFGVGFFVKPEKARAVGNTYYVSSSTGDDSRSAADAQSPETPWAHHPKDINATGNADTVTLNSGDTIVMRRGDTWWNTYINNNTAGLITTSVSGFANTGQENTLPVISGALSPDVLEWTPDGSSYSTPIVTEPKVVTSEAPLTLNNGATNTVASGEWDWDGGTLWVNSAEDLGSIQISQQTFIINASTQNQAFSNLSIRSSNSTAGAVLSAGANNIFNNLSIRWFHKHGIYPNTGSGQQVINCEVELLNIGSTTSHGIYVIAPSASVQGNTVTGSASNATSQSGIYVSGSSSVQVLGNTVTGVTGTGIYLTGSNGTSGAPSSVSNNTLTNNGYASVQIISSSYVTADNNVISGSLGTVGARGIYASAAPNLTISDNTIDGSPTNAASQYGINVTGSSPSTISGNTIRDDAGGGLALLASSHSSTISNNTLTNNTALGMILQNSNDLSVHNNTISGTTGAYGIQLDNANNGDVYSNTVHGNGSGNYPGGSGGGIQLSGSSSSNDIYLNNIYSNYLGLLQQNGATGKLNRIYYNIFRNSTVNSIDISNDGSSADEYTEIFNNTVIHHPSGLNDAAYTGHAIDFQIDAKRGKTANNIIGFISTTEPDTGCSGSNCNGLCFSLTTEDILQVLTDYNFYADLTSAGSALLGKLNNTQYDNLAGFVSALQADDIVKDLDGGTSPEGNSLDGDPKFSDLDENNFTLLYDSPAIDAGVAVSGITTDYLGNPIYGAPDIGAFEYQPPFTIGTDEIDIAGGARIYSDGKFRSKTTEGDEKADLSIQPVDGFATEDYSEWMDVSISEWGGASEDYRREWTENSSNASLETLHVVGDLAPETYYRVSTDGWTHTGQTNGAGELEFTYNGGYSEHTFTLVSYDLPVLTEVTPVSSYTNDTTPSYVVSSNKAGPLSLFGDCATGTNLLAIGDNTITFNALSEGLHNNCTLTVLDAVGGVTSAALSISPFTVDKTAPALTLTSPTSDSYTTSNSSISVVGSSSDSLAGIATLSINGVSISNPASFTATVSNLVIGSNTITIVATDNAGNVTTRTLTVTRQLPPQVNNLVDIVTAASGISTTPTVTDSSYPAFSITDPSTNRNTTVTAGTIPTFNTQYPVLKGHTTPYATVTIEIHSNPFTVETTADENGDWEYALSNPLDFGEHTVKITVKEKDTNTLISENTYKINIVEKAETKAPATESNTENSMLVWIILGVVIIGGAFVALKTAKK